MKFPKTKKETRKQQKIRLDELHSRYIRLRDGLKCRICGKQFEMYENNKGHMVIPQDYQCMHIIGRQHLHTRFDPLNTFGGCVGCHLKFDDHWTKGTEGIRSFRAFALEKVGVGQDLLGILNSRAKLTGKVDFDLIEMWLVKELRKFNDVKLMKPIKSKFEHVM